MFREVYEFFGIFGDALKFFAKLVLFVVLLCLPFGLIHYFANLLEINVNLMIAIVCGIVILLCGYWIYSIWKNPHLARSQKWALMNGREISYEMEVKSTNDIYKELFDEAKRKSKSV